jgi:hypothetical protein
MSKFHHRARRVRHRIPHVTNESRAKNYASQKHEKGTNLWQIAYETKLKSLVIDEKLKILDDARESVSLNREIDIKSFNFTG